MSAEARSSLLSGGVLGSEITRSAPSVDGTCETRQEETIELFPVQTLGWEEPSNLPLISASLASDQSRRRNDTFDTFEFCHFSLTRIRIFKIQYSYLDVLLESRIFPLISNL